MKLPRLRFPLGIDWSLYILPIILSSFGIAIIFSISYPSKSSLPLSQIIFVILGLVIMIALTFFDYRTLKGFSLVLYIIGLLLLILVLFVGAKTLGASRWINLGFFQLQPSELFKIISLIMLARLFSDWQEVNWKHFLLSLIIIVLPILFVLRQPDFGTATIIFIGFLAIILSSKLKKIYLVIALVLVLIFSPTAWHFLKTYQKERIITFIDPSHDPYGTGYNVNQAKIAVGSGGLWGQGLGKGSQGQLNFLPVVRTDFIFAGVAEATGFVGSGILIVILLFLIIRVINVAQKAKDLFGMYFALGYGAILTFQVLINVGMNMGIMPVTGIPLPFVSYGGSAILTNMAAIGILQSIYLRHRKINF